MNSLTAIVLAAGKGTRMRSPISKLLHPVLGEPLVLHPLRALRQAGVDHFIVVVGHAREEVESAVRRAWFLKDMQVDFVEQTEQRGTGHAVMVALSALHAEAKQVVIACGDSPHLGATDIRHLVDQRGAAPLTVLAATVEDPTGLGRMECKGHLVTRIVEQRDADATMQQVRLVNAGAYCVDASFLRQHITTLEPKNAQGELYLTDLVVRAEGKTVCVEALHPDVVLGVNSQQELMRSQRKLVAERLNHWMDQGVCVEHDDVVIGPDVVLAPGARVERGVTLLGRTKVAARAVIEHHAHLVDCEVGVGASVKPFSFAEDSFIGEAAQVGPWARLRKGAKLMNGAEVGNFCEVKASTIGEKSKSHHVSYLGDATIGSGVNIGAGTIICNYDGFNKPQSVIGDRVFVGSNSTLVAPVTIGNDAYIAAGSAITQEVPKEALAIGRARQENKLGYATKLRAGLQAKKAAK